ncbi:hypothetical protein GIS00_03585 [Nakamurella sp. YIM 132087]|uniref:DUF2804 family protein n=1 Tax=Nakamurella alba TaxID=2665158 RepID=A0A7K1FFZ5_9ACTN|nr:hypothetical protein [Nakamurella alba]MTD13027.1 hypothetical protein [Nakamurella alba]
MDERDQQVWTSCKYGADAEETHDGSGIGNWNESYYLNFVDPVAQIGGLLRVGNRPGLGYKEASVQLTLPGGAIAFRAGREQNATNDDFASQGLEFVVKTPTRTVSVRYSNSVARIATPALMADRPRIVLKNSPAEKCTIDLTFEATSPLFVTDPDQLGDCTPGGSVIAADHYEQFGEISGEITVGSRTWGLDRVTAMRDHSWGPREWASFTGEWLCAYFADGTRVTAYSETEDSGARSVGGVVVTADNVLHPITAFTVVTDYAGEATWNGRYRATLRAQGLPMMVLDGTIRHLVPVTQATEDRRVRMAQMTVDFVGPEGGWAAAEFLRPLR